MLVPCSRTASFRTLLLASSVLGLSGTATAQQSATSPGGSLIAHDSPHSNPAVTVIDESNIVISQPGTPTTARDPVDITGVGQMVIDNGGGSVGLCTGTLINPRTMIFAAHCVNSRATSDYGVGGTKIGFGFKMDNLPGIREWLFGATQGASNIATAFYNVNQVAYHPDSLNPAAQSFLFADVAVASFDTPTQDIPQWALLLSALPAPEEINDAVGTGYHVTVTGYGRNGVGPTGDSGGIDYRRRVAENTVGLLGSLNDRNLWLFGTEAGLPQNLYQIDFDDPRRGNAGASPYDFNLFRDPALPREGTTAGGDSGGPLILDETFDEKVVIGVLSGGSRFYAAQPSSAYGTSSFYQPLYLFWDWIAANNPYRYVGAKAGNGAWEDATHWSTLLDPAYRIIDAEGNLVAGIPGAPGAGAFGSDDENKWGQMCFRASAAFQECFDLATGDYLVNGVVQNSGGQDISTNAAGGDVDVRTGKFSGELVAEDTPYDATARIEGAHDAAAAPGDVGVAALPAATLANGLPGATNFVPNNVDPAAGVAARYYDVTLSATGTTTLSSAVTVDRLTVSGAGATLSIAASGALTSLLDINQLTGAVVVDGRLSTRGDYFLMTGGLMGSGTVSTPYFTSLAGTIAPGTMGTIGTLTFNGNVILASGSRLLVDLGPNGASDRVVVNAGNGQPGIADVGGFVGFAPVAGHRIRDGQIYTILTAQGGLTGTFETAALSAILTPELTYGPNSVQVEIEAGNYVDVIDPASPIQSSFARLLDQNRVQYDRHADLYGELDLQDAGTIRSQLEGFAPHAQVAGAMQGIVATDTTSRFIRARMARADRTDAGGTIAMYGKPIQLASLAASNLAGNIQSDIGNGMMVRPGALPDDVAVYLAGGYIDGRGAGLPTATPTGRADFDGYFIAAGIENTREDATIGFAMTYSDLKGDSVLPSQSASSQLVQGTLYGATTMGALKLDAMVSAGVFEVDTRRQVAVGASQFDLSATDRAFAFQSEAGIGIDAAFASGTLTPRASVRFAHIGFTDTVESGGGPALQYRLGKFESLQSRVGATLQLGNDRVRPFVTANYVHEFEDRPAFLGANFRGGVGPQALIALPGADRDWAEVSGGLQIGGERVSFAVEAETTIARDDVRNQSYRGTLTVRF